MPWLERQGVRLEYEVHPSSKGGGEPLLLTHGYGASRRMWAANVEALAQHRDVLSWDMRGHGSTQAPNAPELYSHEACLLDMAALLDAVGAGSAVLGGMSLGGFLSLLFTLRHPERVTGLVLVDTGPGFRSPEAREGWNRWAREKADELEANGLEALPGGREQSAEQHVHGAVGLAHAARGVLTQKDAAVFEALGKIAVPTLIVVGSEDERFLPAAEVMERRIAGARRVVLQGAGHAANLDAPGEFNSVVGRFLEEL